MKKKISLMKRFRNGQPITFALQKILYAHTSTPYLYYCLEFQERLEESGRTLAATTDGTEGCEGLSFGSMLKGGLEIRGFIWNSSFLGAMDGFGGGDMGSIMGTISDLAGGGGAGGLLILRFCVRVHFIVNFRGIIQNTIFITPWI